MSSVLGPEVRQAAIEVLWGLVRFADRSKSLAHSYLMSTLYIQELVHLNFFASIPVLSDILYCCH
jgi:hypothetical protein